MKTKSGLRYTQRKTLPSFTRPKVHSCTDFFVDLIKCNSNNCYLTKKIPRFSLLNEVLIWPGISFCSISSRSIHRSIIQTIYQWCTYINYLHYISSTYSWFHEKGSFSVHSCNEDYLSIPEFPSSWGNHFMKSPVSWLYIYHMSV